MIMKVGDERQILAYDFYDEDYRENLRWGEFSSFANNAGAKRLARIDPDFVSLSLLLIFLKSDCSLPGFVPDFELTSTWNGRAFTVT